jgi:multisubunit Na+/H+ antiporter MnhG subunit
MSEHLIYEFRMTSEFAGAETGTLEQALWMQNERLHQHLEARMRFRSHLPSLGVVLSALGLVLALLGWALAPQKRAFFASIFAAFVGLLLAFVFISSIARALRRFARRMVSSRARKMMRRVAERAPYTITYELRDGVLVTGIDTMGVLKVLDLKRVRVAIETPSFICAFCRPLGQIPARVLYVPGPLEHAGLCAALAANGSEMLHLPSD